MVVTWIDNSVRTLNSYRAIDLITTLSSIDKYEVNIPKKTSKLFKDEKGYIGKAYHIKTILNMWNSNSSK